MAFPTTGLLDDFTRADDPASAGANWSMSNQLFGIISNSLYNPVLSGFSIGYWNPGTFGPDAECYATVSTLPASSQEVSVWLRMTDPVLANFTCYGATWTAGSNSLRLRKFISGSGTDLNTTSLTLAAGDRLGVEVIGNSPATLNAYQYTGGAWSLVLTTTDSSISAAGYLGCTIQNSVARLDDFSGGTTAAPAPFVFERTQSAVYRM